ncbi:MAG: DUF6456 domain-containing protein [Rhizomicrobium sp.]
MSGLGEGEIAREARRIFRALGTPGAHLVRDDAGQYRLVGRDGGRDGIAPALIDVFLRRGWLARAGGAGQLVASEAGLGWYARAVADDTPFAAQHQIRGRKRVTDRRGVERLVAVNAGESVLSRLRQRGLLDAAQFDAGEKLRRDFTLAQLMPRLGVDLTAPIVLGRRGQTQGAPVGDMVLAAKQRFARALAAVGPGLSDLLFDVVCYLRGLEDAERAYGWPHRSARVVLGLALDRLADHYGLRVRGKAKLRGWRALPS